MNGKSFPIDCKGEKKDIEEGKNKVSVAPSLCSPFSSFIEK